MGERRLRVLLAVLAVIAAPAAALRFACAGSSCPAPVPAPAPAPFCGLPADVRTLIAAGYREGRSADVFAATSEGSVLSEPGPDGPVPWPATDAGAVDVPLAFGGTGVRDGPLADGTRLDAVAPTLASMLGFARPFPEVRSGRSVAGVVRPDGAAPLAVLVVWSGIGSREVRAVPSAWRAVTDALGPAVSTLEGSTGSLPVDPVAALATVGIGAVPAEHGVTGALVRADDGATTDAWGARAPIPVLATLAEDLDETSEQASRIGLVGSVPADRVLVGGAWYTDEDRDDVRLGGDPVAAVRGLVAAGFGGGGAADLLGVVLHGRVEAAGEATAAIVRAVRRAVPDAAIAVAGTGSLAPPTPSMPAADVTAAVDGLASADVVEAVGAGGLFLDAGAGVGSDAVAAAMRGPGWPTAGPVLADAYPGFSITLAGYC
jgi:hypothetical protein